MGFANFRGLGSALITPFTNGGEIDYDALDKLIEFQVSSGVDFVVMAGTTGEGVTLEDDETVEMLKFTLDKVAKRVPVVAGCGSNNTNSLVKKIKNLNTLNLDGYLVVSPYYNKPTQEGLVGHYSEVAKAAGDTPIILYNVPGRTSGWIMPDTVAELASRNKDMYRTVTAKVPGFVFLCGDDTITLPLMAVGYSGGISVVSNEAPRQMKEMVSLALKGDFASASKTHYALLPLMRANFMESNPGPVKYAMKKLGYGDGTVRLPLSELKDTSTMDKVLKNYL
jgi:4-hydroxy-tetrahydrodipicolinate synthase